MKILMLPTIRKVNRKKYKFKIRSEIDTNVTGPYKVK